jgi:hypothetical protein
MVKTYFLFGFAYRGVCQARIDVFASAAREGDLVLVVSNTVGPLNEQNIILPIFDIQGNEYRRLCAFCVDNPFDCALFKGLRKPIYHNLILAPLVI